MLQKHKSKNYLKNWAVEEECQQLDQVIMDISLFFLNSYYIRRVERFGLVQLNVLIEWEEAKLEEVFYHYGHLDEKRTQEKNNFIGIVVAYWLEHVILVDI